MTGVQTCALPIYVLTDSEQVGQWGAPTLDVWVVRKDFAEKHPEVVKAFAKSAIDAQQPYIAMALGLC